jgi:ATP synthase protein I
MASKPLNKIIQHEAYRIVFWQLVGIVVLALFALLTSGITSGFSVLAGGMAYGLPNLIFVWRVFKFAGAHQMTQFITAFFLGETMKLVLSALLFLVIVKYLSVSLLSGLIGFAGAIVSFWIVCMWHFSKQQPARSD